MNRRFTLLTLLTACATAAGCANINSIGRSTTYGETGKAIHLDAKQRVVMTKKFSDIYCAEPSPDALSAYAASLSGSAAVPQEFSASLAAALSESSANIGLRTQSIQLMRDALYRICEMYYGRALDGLMVQQLHERYQDVMVGVLAIEQLTGTVRAQQVALGGTSTADATSQLLDLQRILEQAREKEEAAQRAASAAKASSDNASAELAAAQSALQAEQGKQPPNNDEIARLSKAVEEKTEAAENAAAASDTTQQNAADATKNRELIENSRDAAQSTASAATTSTSSFGAGTVLANPNGKVTKEIANAVKDIVHTIVDKNHVVDSCLVIISSFSRKRDSEDFRNRENDRQSILDFCTDVLRSLGGERVAEMLR